MHKTLLALLLPAAVAPAAHAQTIGINLDAPVTMSGGSNDLLMGFPWGGGNQQSFVLEW